MLTAWVNMPTVPTGPAVCAAWDDPESIFKDFCQFTAFDAEKIMLHYEVRLFLNLVWIIHLNVCENVFCTANSLKRIHVFFR